MTGIYSLLEGKTLGGRYRIERLVSKGGMGAVFRAADLQLGREVAVKVIAIEPESPEQASMLRARFRREALAAARLRHANVVTLHDFGTDEAMGLDYIVMELLDGEDIQRRVRRTGPMSWKQASRILYEAAKGLGAGHRAGLVHRDVKSANLFLEHDSNGKPVRTRVLDFGIAQLTADGTGTATHLTVLGHAPLSPPYASPEQQRGAASLTPAADVWGLGVTAFEMLTGSLPFTEEQRAALATGARIPLPSISRINTSVPPAAEDLIRRALSPDPTERPRDGEAFAREVSAIRRDLQAEGAAPRSRPRDSVPVETQQATLAQESPPPFPARARQSGARVPPSRAMGAMILLVSACIVIAIAFEAGRSGDVLGAGDVDLQQSLAATTINPAREATEGEINYIRRIYQQIENGGQTFGQRRVELGRLARLEWPSADSVYASVYDGGYGTQKVRVRVFQGEDRTSLLFYYDAGNLVFVHDVHRPYGASSNNEQRYYFLNRALIRWRDMSNSIVPLSPAYDERAARLLRISDAVLAEASR
jgi:serine/threonine protein kinase